MIFFLFSAKCFNCEAKSKKVCRECISDYRLEDSSVSFCEDCMEKVHSHSNRKTHKPEWCQEVAYLLKIAEFELLSVICIETSHYVCFTRSGKRWIFFDSMGNRVCKSYYVELARASFMD